MTIEKRMFGNTGHKSSVVIFGAAALWNETQDAADRILDLILEYGINHIDVAPRYGEAELRVGSWMRRYRKDFFLATKTAARSYHGAKEEIFRSLDRLKTDYIDLIQMHSLTHPDEWEQAFASEGALEALKEVRNEGLVKFIGVTGHGWTAPAMHKKSIERFDFNSILMPWNWLVAHYKNYPEDFQKTTELCIKKNIAVQTIKSIARGPWSAGVKPNYTTWYQPLEDYDSIRKSVHWVLSHKDIFLNSIGDVKILPLVLRAADTFAECPSDEDMHSMSEKFGLASIFGI